MKRALAALASLVQHKRTKKESPISFYSSDDDTVHRSNKRRKISNELEGTRTPCLLSHEDLPTPSCLKRRNRTDIKGGLAVRSLEQPFATDEGSTIPSSRPSIVQTQSQLFRMIPTEVIGHCLSFLCTAEDRSALQRTCSHFRGLSDADDILRGIKLSGEPLTGKGGFITTSDTRESAQKRLEKFVIAGNLEAYYMTGMIRAYCFDDVTEGVRLLRKASFHSHARSSYALGLILRDTHRDESSEMLHRAATLGFLPALQEILSAREMKSRHGEPSAEELGKYLDPMCLSRLLSDHYARDPEIRSKHTSHCWNPLCGRWAYKQTSISSISAPNRFFTDAVDMVGLEGINMDHYVAFERVGVELATGRPMLGVRLPTPINFFSRELSTSVSDPETSAGVRGPRERSSSNIPLNASENGTKPVGEAGSPQAHQFTSHARCQVRDDRLERARVSRMKMCSSCRRAKYCSKLCQVYDWRSGRHKLECQYL